MPSKPLHLFHVYNVLSASKYVNASGSVLRLNEYSHLNMFQMIDTKLSTSVVGSMVVLFVVLLCSGFRSL